MSEADRLFRELGYTKSPTMMIGNCSYIAYTKMEASGMEWRIEFHYAPEVVNVYCVQSGDYMPICLTMQELKAINKKCLELRMDRGVIK